MKKVLVSLLILSSLALGKNIKKPEKVKIGITQIVEHQALDSARDGFLRALKENGYEKAKIDYQNAQGDFVTSQMIASSFVQNKKDLIYAISTPSAQTAYNVTKDIPILITAVTDVESAGLVAKNITGTSDATSVYNQMEKVIKILPNTKKVGVVYNTGEQNSIVLVERTKKACEKLGLDLVAVGVSSISDVSIALDNVLGKVDILYTPTDNLIVSATPLVLDKANKANKPVIGCIEDQVAQGALLTDTIDYEKLGYQTGLMAIDVLKGKNIEDMPVETLKDTQIIINKKSAEKYGIDLGLEVLKDAKVY